MSRRALPVVVAIGGFDPSCGAGVVADARSIEAMGALPAAVATSLTVQSGTGVRGYRAVPAAQVMAQLEEVLRGLPVRGAKLGQVPTAALARALGTRLRRAGIPFVVDPVLEASGGGRLVARGTAAAIARFLLPGAALVTANLDEAARLCGTGPVATRERMRAAARSLVAAGAAAALVKGGHLAGAPVDVLVHAGGIVEWKGRRLAASMHGTGCALAAAAAARLALGDDVEEAVEAARAHVRRLLATSVRAGAARLRAPGAN